MGPEGSKPNPSYKEVCSGSTGHVEVYDFQYSGDEEMYEQLVRFFFQFHDPTTLNAQQNDTGTQYASVRHVSLTVLCCVVLPLFCHLFKRKYI
jgi:methionine-S-sulfoxide reductase